MLCGQMCTAASKLTSFVETMRKKHADESSEFTVQTDKASGLDRTWTAHHYIRISKKFSPLDKFFWGQHRTLSNDT